MESTDSFDIRVRKGTAADAQLLGDLISALADYEKLPRPTNEARLRLVRDAYGPQPRIETWFGELDGKVAGYAISFYTYSTFLAQPTFYLEDLFVLPEFRANKVGKALFMNCVRVAFDQGCGRMEWQVLDWNKTAINFYNHFGATLMSDWLPYRATRTDLESMLLM